MIDATFAIYTFTSVLAFTGFCLFAWWWYRMRSASEVFIYINLLLGFLAFERSLLAIFRWIAIYEGADKALSIAQSQWWALRTIPELIIVALIVTRMACRAYRTIRLEHRYSKTGSKACEGFIDNE